MSKMLKCMLFLRKKSSKIILDEIFSYIKVQFFSLDSVTLKNCRTSGSFIAILYDKHVLLKFMKKSLRKNTGSVSIFTSSFLR